MDIKVNGETREIEEGLTIERMLERLGIENRNLAIEYNGEFIEGETLGRATLRPGDALEIVRFVGGG